jgi:hypothetical protein
MKSHSLGHCLLALAALTALTVYVLACGTSFSPDDSKVLYSTINAKTGATGVAVYDRTTGKSELLFGPTHLEGDGLKTAPQILRPQWISNGHGVLVGWPGKDGLNLTVLPAGGPGPIRLYSLPDQDKNFSPLPVAGTCLFLIGQSNTLVRLDLASGAVRRTPGLPEMTLLPTPRGDQLLYLAESGEGDTASTEVGLLNPETFGRTPLHHLKGAELKAEDGFCALSREGKRLALCAKVDDKWVLRVMDNGQPFRTVPLALEASAVKFGNAQFGPGGEVVYASFLQTGDETNSLGILEIPINGGPIRRTTLIGDLGKVSKESALYLEPEVSHDGKTLAVASTYLAFDEHPSLKAEDCALFLVNLTDPQRRVTKVPIPLPPAGVTLDK